MGNNNSKNKKTTSQTCLTFNNIEINDNVSDLENQISNIEAENNELFDNVSSLHTYNSNNSTEPASSEKKESTRIDNITEQMNKLEELYCEIQREENVLSVILKSLENLEESTESPEKILDAKKIFNEKLNLIKESLKKKNMMLSELILIKNKDNKYGILHRSEIDFIIKEKKMLNNIENDRLSDDSEPPPLSPSKNNSKEKSQLETLNSKLNTEGNNNTSLQMKFSRTNSLSPRPIQTDNSNNNVYYGKIKKTTFSEVYNILEELFHKQSNNSLILDIIIIYIKCQKILYIEAKTFCEGKLYKLMLPAIFISALTSILSLSMSSLSWSPILISCISGINSFILALISYLKLDGKAEAHKISAHKFDKLQSYCEFKSGQLLLTDNKISIKQDKEGKEKEKDKEKIHNHNDCNCKKTETIDDIINAIGEKVKEIKETNNFILPEIIRYKFKETYASNIFGDVKELQNTEYTLINELKNKINKVRLCENKLIQLYQQNSNNTLKTTEEEEYEQLLDKLELEKQSQIKDIILYKNNYIKLYDGYKKEMNNYIDKNMNKKIHFCSMLRT